MVLIPTSHLSRVLPPVPPSLAPLPEFALPTIALRGVTTPYFLVTARFDHSLDTAIGGVPPPYDDATNETAYAVAWGGDVEVGRFDVVLSSSRK